jgi:putative hydrolase of the HAD superfamily
MTERRFEVIGFDADDTLWRSEDGFAVSEQAFVDLVAPYAPAGADVLGALHATERKNLGAFGYGVKSFGLSMVEAAVTVTGGALPGLVARQLVELTRDQLQEPVELLPDVPEVLAAVGRMHRLVLITKGDLIHQTHKVTTSGLEHHFDEIDIVLEKDPATYAKVLRRVGVEPGRFCMVGNSIRSDVLPVMALGGHAVHIPYHITWAHEEVDDHGQHVVVLTSLAELPGWLDGQ